MKLAVINEGIWRNSVSGQGLNKRVTFKNVEDESDTGYYYLNITDYEFDTQAKQKVQAKWEPVCKKGNVLDVPVFEGSRNINKFGQFTIIKEVK